MKVAQLAPKLKSFRLEINPTQVLVCHGLVFSIGLISLICFYWPTFSNLIHKYSTSGTYAHGFIIYPLVAWMIFQKRHLFHSQKPKYEILGLASIFLLSMVWYVAHLAQVGIIQQLCCILMMISLFVTCFGIKTTQLFLFPLGYLFFAIPFGNFLTPSLQNLTANFAVFSLELTGIPVFYEGWQISTSTGEFEVAEACSGIRYLIATLALGVLYAYFTYQKNYKRILFAAICLFVPLLANGIRAYFIILIAHYSKMKYAVGVDHLIYGWIFFGFIIFILFSVGSRFRDPPQEVVPFEPYVDPQGSSKIHFGFAFAVVMALGISPLLNMASNMQTLSDEAMSFEWPQGQSGWQGPIESVDTWGPDFKGPAIEQMTRYIKGTHEVTTFAAIYLNQKKGSELISENNQFYNRLKWSLLEKSLYAFDHGEISSVVELNIHSRGEKRLVWYWYVVGGVPTTNPIWGKILEGYSMVRHSQKPSGVIMISAEYDYYPDSARTQLEAFVDQMGLKFMHELFKSDE